MTDVYDAEIVPVGPPGGELAVRPDTTNRDRAAVAWVESYSESPNTAERYARDVLGWRWSRDDHTVIPSAIRIPGSFFAWLDTEGLDVLDVLPWQVEKWMRHLQTSEHVGRYTNARRLSKATISGKLAAVSSFYKYLGTQSRREKVFNPVVGIRRPKAPRLSGTLALTREEVDAIRDVALKRGSREYALVMVLALTGVRVSELCGLDTGDLVRDAGEWMLRVVRKGGDVALVPCPDPAARALRRYKRGRRGPMFLRPDGERITRQSAGQTLYSLATAAFPATDEGRDRAKRVTPHVLRHTVATLTLRQEGVNILDVQALLGHASVSTTQRYEHSNRVRDNPAAKALGVMFEDGLPDFDE